MAKSENGKGKFNLLGKGLAQRLFKGDRQQPDGSDYIEDDLPEEAYAGQEGDYDAGEAYTGSRFDDRFDSDGEYGDENYADDYDDGYDEADRYEDDYDDDGQYDDQYDDRYDEDDYADGYDEPSDDGEEEAYASDYDDRYSTGDADDNYDDGEYYPRSNGLLRYVDEHDWVTYLLLFLFPPLGIYLLWRRGRFDKPVRWAVTAASAIWFVVALIFLLRGLIGGIGDQQVQPNITIPPASSIQTEQPDEPSGSDGDIDVIDLGGGVSGEDTGDEGAETEASDDALAASPSPTPLANAASGASADNADYVWSPASGLYYHASETCPSIEEGVQVWRVTKEIAENSRHQSPCPDCIGGGTATTYYGTLGGKYYHTDASCSSMKNPLVYTKQAAENEGKTPCPVCILKTQESLAESENVSTAIITTDSQDNSGIQVYATKNGNYYHVKSDCSGMQNAKQGSLKEALLAGKSACPVCCAQAGTLVYCTSGGKSYHLDRNCQGMTGARQVSLAEAMVMGKSKCNVCIKGSLAAATDPTLSEETPAEGSVSLTSGTGDDVKVYATPNGTYYHTNSTCSGMKDAQLYSLKSMIAAGKAACPVCASSANTQVYATKGGKYYHSYATCSGMKNAGKGTLAEALAAGLERCPECWGSTASATGTQTSVKQAASTDTNQSQVSKVSAARQASQARAQAAPSKATAGNTYVYATREGSYYHLNSGCGGMTGASRISLKTAVKAGKKPCPICASSATRTVYSTDKGDHYHAASICAPSGMKNGKKRTLAEALLLNQTACPYCLSSKKAATAATKTAQQITQAVAGAREAEAQAAKAAQLAKAAEAAQAAKAAEAAEKAKTAQAARALKAFASRSSSTAYKSGSSGVRVYATLTGKYYHTRSNCSNLSGSPSRVTLETALNYGKKACPVCSASATRTVYATRGGKYYHYSKSDAGSGAERGTLASALAYGLEPCPNCVTHTAARETAERSGVYTSGTSGIKVYATQGSRYYHSKANCSGLTGATRVSLETALNYGKTACPVCMATASQKVYVQPGGKTYHYSKAHAGSGAIAGSLAAAKALGLKACSLCTKLSAGVSSPDNGGAEYAPVSIQLYEAPADSKVYIDLGTINTYYHSSAKCADTGFENGSAVTLQYATEWEYKACPYCNPPTSVLSDSEET